jgi:hypothetical protein
VWVALAPSLGGGGGGGAGGGAALIGTARRLYPGTVRRTAASLALLFAVAGCRQILGLDELSVDAYTGDTFTPTCVGSGNFSVCFPYPPQAGDLTPHSPIQTDSDLECERTQPDGWEMNGNPDSCFIYGTNVVLSSMQMTLATGSRPLVLVATQEIDVGLGVDVSSKYTVVGQGAGGNSVTCVAGTGGPTPGTHGGGAGGSFTTEGGFGGNNFNGQGGGVPPGATSQVTALRGGCSGQTGDGGSPGFGGGGGGAVFLVAGQSIVVHSFIDASGAAGGGGVAGVPGGGAGGGGSGGMIVLIASTVDITNARLYADGGGGGGGGGSVAGSPGLDSDGTSTCCGGGAMFSAGGHGGHGTGAAGAGGAATSVSNGGGGGGGSVGYVGIGGSVQGAPARVSPPAASL